MRFEDETFREAEPEWLRGTGFEFQTNQLPRRGFAKWATGRPLLYKEEGFSVAATCNNGCPDTRKGGVASLAFKDDLTYEW